MSQKAKTEHKIQAAYIAWHRRQSFPGWIFAVPNGGARDAITGALLRAEGVAPGVPDVFYAWPCGGYAGLWLEFKTPTGTVSCVQKSMIADLRAAGYACEVVRSGGAAREIVERYLSKKYSAQNA